jgi:hypothetical protein
LPQNVHRKKGTIKKDEREKARENKHLKLFNIFVVIGKTWRTIIGYEVPNGVGKMNTKVYTEQVLPQLLEKAVSLSSAACT